jgi:hypothetical protein
MSYTTETEEKFQILQSESRVLVIEKIEEEGAKPRWEVAVPNAGTLAMGKKLARLLNAEYTQYRKTISERAASERSNAQSWTS